MAEPVRSRLAVLGWVFVLEWMRYVASETIDEHSELAAQSVDKTQVALIFGAVTSRLGVGPFTYEGMNMDNLIDQILNES